MKNKIIIGVIIALFLFGGYLIKNSLNKKESKEEVIELVDEPKEIKEVEEPKEQEEPKEEVEQQEIKTEESKTKTTTKKKNTTKKKTTKPKIIETNVPYNKGDLQHYAHELVLEYGWTEEDYQALVLLWYRESDWNPNAVNKKNGACGIPQANPCSKMSIEGSDFRTNGKTQIRWGLNYIKENYENPTDAWKHFQRKGGY